MLQVQYGFLETVNKEELRMVMNAVSTDARMRKIYSELCLVGFPLVAKGLDAVDRATLTFVEKYIKFKQGEVWFDMSCSFRTTGFKPTAPDRERLASGIDFSQYLATMVVKEQQTMFLGASQSKCRRSLLTNSRRTTSHGFKRLNATSIFRSRSKNRVFILAYPKPILTQNYS